MSRYITSFGKILLQIVKTEQIVTILLQTVIGITIPTNLLQFAIAITNFGSYYKF